MMMRWVPSIVVSDRAAAAEQSALFHVGSWSTCSALWTCFCEFVSPQQFSLPRGSRHEMSLQWDGLRTKRICCSFPKNPDIGGIHQLLKFSELFCLNSCGYKSHHFSNFCPVDVMDPSWLCLDWSVFSTRLLQTRHVLYLNETSDFICSIIVWLV